MTDVVLDASALLALLQNENGANEVRERIHGALLSTVNLAEVLTKGMEKGVPLPQQVQVIGALPLQVIPFDAELAHATAQLRPATRNAGLSLGDRACLALALSRQIPAVTAERDWDKVDVGVRVIRIR